MQVMAQCMIDPFAACLKSPTERDRILRTPCSCHTSSPTSQLLCRELLTGLKTCRTSGSKCSHQIGNFVLTIIVWVPGALYSLVSWEADEIHSKGNLTRGTWFGGKYVIGYIFLACIYNPTQQITIMKWTSSAATGFIVKSILKSNITISSNSFTRTNCKCLIDINSYVPNCAVSDVS